MLKTLPILLLVAATHCQSVEDVDSLITEIFNPTYTTATNQTKDKTQTSTILQPIQTDKGPSDLDSLIAEVFNSTHMPATNQTKDKTQTSTILQPIKTDKGPSDLDSLIAEIFNSTHMPATNQTKDKTQTSSIVQPTQTDTGATVENTCMLSDGQKGECVPYYLCKINNYDADIIDIHDEPILCLSYIDVCCPELDKIPPNQLTKPLANQSEREGCGWANPDGVDMGNVDVSNDETKFGEFPWTVAILKVESLNYTEPEGKKQNVYIGGGSLIHPSVVLTVAHYIVGVKTLRIRAGEWDTQMTKEIYPFQEREVASVDIHKDFEKGKLFYDIAVAFLAEPVDLAPNVGLACLPPARIPQKEGVRCFATGWGKDKFGRDGRFSTILKKIELPVVEHDKCQAVLRETRLGKYFELHSSFMCAGGEPGKDTCKGDGGAPLSCPIEHEKDRYVQSGIVAWGIGCGEAGTPGVYVDVSVLRDWIDDKVAGKGYDPQTYTY